MARPQSSLGNVVYGALDLGMDAVQIGQIKAMRGQLDDLRRAHAHNTNVYIEGTKAKLKHLDAILQVQIASVASLVEIDGKLGKLSENSWEIASHLERREGERKFLGDIRIIVHNLNRELDDIEELMEEFAPWGFLKLNLLKEQLVKHDVRIDHFAKLHHSEIEWAQAFLDRVSEIERRYVRKLEMGS